MFARNGRTGCRINCLLNIARFVHLISSGLFRHVHKRGNGTVIWVVNDKDEIRELKNQFGDHLDGIMTDMPTNLCEYAHEYGSENFV